jgi:hypothetical protein
MSADRPSPPSPPVGRRRSSFAGQFVDLFGRSSSSSTAGNAQPAAYPGPITEAAAQAQRRRLSLTTLGLSGSPNQTSPFTPARTRTESTSSANSGSVDENPFEDIDIAPSSSLPATPFGRRLSFGARALRDVRTGSVTSPNGNGGSGGGGGGGSSGNGNPRPSVSKASTSSSTSRSTPPTAKSNHGRGLSSFSTSLMRSSSLSSKHVTEDPSLTGASSAFTAGQGFDFAENLRSRAERGSISTASGLGGGGGGMPSPPLHHRAKSVATESPTQAVPKQPRVPDPIQERMLRGDFYMD